VHGALALVQVAFASLSTAMKVALGHLSPTGVLSFRVGAATVVFVAAALVAGERQRIARADWARLALYALLGVIANQLLFIYGLAHTTATDAVVLGASIPVFTVGAAVALRRERATLLKLAGLLVALAGALLLAAAAGAGRPGNWLVLANSLCFSFYLVLQRDLLARYRATTVVAATFAIAAVVLVPLGAPALFHAAPTLAPRGWGALGYIVVVATVLPYLLNAWALQRVPASVVAIYIYLQPLIGALIAAVVLGERPGWVTLAAAILIGGGIALVVRDARS
jgi:drug/metabolite transporter (DMT)-like permease